MSVLELFPILIADFELNQETRDRLRATSNVRQKEPVTKRQKSEPKLLEVHAIGFALASLDWPPTGAQCHEICGDCVVSLNQRPMEVALFNAVAFPPGH